MGIIFGGHLSKNRAKLRIFVCQGKHCCMEKMENQYTDDFCLFFIGMEVFLPYWHVENETENDARQTEYKAQRLEKTTRTISLEPRQANLCLRAFRHDKF